MFRIKQARFLERLLPSGQRHFSQAGPVRLAGELALTAALDILMGLEPSCLDSTPRLKFFYEDVIASKAFDRIRDLPSYAKRN